MNFGKLDSGEPCPALSCGHNLISFEAMISFDNTAWHNDYYDPGTDMFINGADMMAKEVETFHFHYPNPGLDHALFLQLDDWLMDLEVMVKAHYNGAFVLSMEPMDDSGMGVNAKILFLFDSDVTEAQLDTALATDSRNTSSNTTLTPQPAKSKFCLSGSAASKSRAKQADSGALFAHRGTRLDISLRQMEVKTKNHVCLQLRGLAKGRHWVLCNHNTRRPILKPILLLTEKSLLECISTLPAVEHHFPT